MKGGEGEAKKGAGLRNRVSWQESQHQEVFSRSNLWAKNLSKYIFEKFIEKARRSNGLAMPNNSGFTGS